MSLPLKAGVATLAISSIGGITAGLGTYFGTNREEIKKGQLISDLIDQQYDYILLDTETESNAWEALWAKYKQDNIKNPKGQDTLKLVGWPDADDTKLTKELKQKCKTLSKATERKIRDDLYKKITTYCAREVTFEEKAVREGLRIADTKGDQHIWDDRQKRGLSEFLDDLARLKSGGLGIVLKPEKIKQGCEEAKANSKKAKGHDPIYSSYKKVCTKGDKEQ